MAILETGNTFSTGNQVTAATLNAAINEATFKTGTSGATDDTTISIDGSGRLYVKDSNITAAKLATNSVTTAKIANDSVTPAKLSEGGPSWTSSTLHVTGNLDFSHISTADLNGTYGRSGTTVNITMANHGMSSGMLANLTFEQGTGGVATNGAYVVDVDSSSVFNITDTVSGTITGNPVCTRTSYYGTSTIRGSQSIRGNLDVSRDTELDGNVTIGGDAVISGDLEVGGSSVYPLVSGNAVTTTSGTSVDFTSIPSWVKRITVLFNYVSTNGEGNYLIRIGDSGGVETTGYGSCASDDNGRISSTSGFILNRAINPASDYSGLVVLCRVSTNIWVSAGQISDSYYSFVCSSAGKKSLSSTLTTVRITTTSGDTFDGGSVNIMYE